MKINITIPDELLEKIDTFAKSNFQTRSGFLQLAAARFLSDEEIRLANLTKKTSTVTIEEK